MSKGEATSGRARPSPRLGVSLRHAYRPRSVRERDLLDSRHACAACGKKRVYVVGDKGLRRTLGDIVYYRIALKCRCGFMNFVNVVVNDLPGERRPGMPSSLEAIRKAEESGQLEDPVLEEMLLDSAVAGFRQEWETAVRLVEQCVKRAPRHPAAWFNVGCTHAAGGDHTKALTAFRRVTELSDSFPSAWLNMGLAHQALNEPVKAVECFDRFLAKYPTHGPALRGRKECLEQIGQGAGPGDGEATADPAS